MYRPKFCVECGGKIIRVRWRPWTSRKFCEACSPGFRKAQLTHLAIAGGVLFVVGWAFGHAVRSASPPLLIERRQEASSGSPRKGKSSADGPALAENGAGDSASNSSSAVAEVYMCGARTKKGTPCTRRVHGPVRCWQHKGMPAALSPEKLRVQE
jgi:hypothetical protein